MNIIAGNKNFLLLKFKISQLIKFLKKPVLLKTFGNSDTLINKVYVINLDRQTERWRMIQDELQSIITKENSNLLDYSERVSAIDATNGKLSTHKIEKSYNLEDQYFVDPDPRLLNIIREKEIKVDLTNQETAVALSHISIWEKIVNNKISNALILEDDVYFESNFSKQLNSIWEEINSSKIEFDILFVSYKKVDHNPDIKNVSKNLSIPTRGIWWFSGYILSLKGAKKLLDKIPIVGPIDLWINHEFKNIDVFLSNNSIINQKLFLQSDNNYSILPILSQIGIKSNETFINLDKAKGKNPVFIFDFSDYSINNLTKLNALLSLNSYKVYRKKSITDDTHIEEILKNKKTLLFDAYLGFNAIFNNLSDWKLFYPNAIFIVIKNENDLLKATNIFTFNTHDKFLIKKISNLLKIKYWKSIKAETNFITVGEQIPAKKNQIANSYKFLEHDVNPWIIPIQNIQKYLPYNLEEFETYSHGQLCNKFEDSFESFNNAYWRILEDTFPSNQAYFTSENFALNKSGFEIIISKKELKGKQYSSSSIVSKKSSLYGSFEISMKPVKGNGIISAFFLHRNDPWQEIDIEFTGDDTSKILLNVYYNPGMEKLNFNYGVRGTPILIDLGFDASEEFHTYRIEWEHHEIRWYVDDKIIHYRKVWTPTPIPDLPLKVYVNAWITNSESLAGRFKSEILPKTLNVKNIKIMEFKY